MIYQFKNVFQHVQGLIKNGKEIFAFVLMVFNHMVLTVFQNANKINKEKMECVFVRWVSLKIIKGNVFHNIVKQDNIEIIDMNVLIIVQKITRNGIQLEEFVFVKQDSIEINIEIVFKFNVL